MVTQHGNKERHHHVSATDTEITEQLPRSLELPINSPMLIQLETLEYQTGITAMLFRYAQKLASGIWGWTKMMN